MSRNTYLMKETEVKMFFLKFIISTLPFHLGKKNVVSWKRDFLVSKKNKHSTKTFLTYFLLIKRKFNVIND